MNSRIRWIGLLVVSVAVSLIIVDTTIVNVAIPSIVGDLGIDSAQVQWVQTSYTLVFAALLIPFGAIGDRIGRRKVLMLGVLVFTAASIAAGLAVDGTMLIAARVLQGVGGAMVLPATAALINAGFRGKERAMAFAIWGSTIGGMAAIGPLLGGWLTTDFSWRWAFGVNVPFGILVIVGAILTVAESRSEQRERLDVVGAALSILAAGSLVFALIEGRTTGWWTPTDATAEWWPWPVSPIPLLLALAVVAGAGLVLWSRMRLRRGQAAMLPLDLLSIVSFRNGNVVAALVSLGELGVLFVLPLWLQNVLRYDALQTGFVLLALAIGSFLASGAISGLSRRLGPVAILRLGVVLEFAALLALGLTLRDDLGWFQLAVLLFVYGLGIGLASAQVTNVVLADVPVRDSGRASGAQSTARQVGSALGVATIGTILFVALGAQLSDRLTELPAEQSDQIVAAVTDSAGAAIPGLLDDPATAEIGRMAAESLTAAASAASFGAAGFLAVALLASAFLGRKSRAAAARGAAAGSGAEPRGAAVG